MEVNEGVASADEDEDEHDDEDCIKYELAAPRLIATAVDPNIVPLTSVTVIEGGALALGQDATWSSAGAGNIATESSLRQSMLNLVAWFARSDPDGKAMGFIVQFLAKRAQVVTITSAALDEAILQHPNFVGFSERALNAPGRPGFDPSRPRIHQALKDAGWDINQAIAATGLVPPAFNLGSASMMSGDFSTGVALMTNGMQYAFIYATSYSYDSCENAYEITLKYVLYDVFGLDDDDNREFGGDWQPPAVAIRSWWRLQFEFGYAPFITKVVATRQFRVSTLG